MEIDLLNWLFSLKIQDRWIAEKIKDISNNNNHITIKSLKNNLNFENDQFNQKFNQHIEQEDSYNNCKRIVYKINDEIFCNRLEDNYKMVLICLEILKNNKKLLLIKNENNIITNCDSRSSNQDDISSSGDLLFLNKIWRNNFIRNEILFHCKLFKNQRFKFTFNSISKLNQYKFKDYLNYINFVFKNQNQTIDDLNDFLEFKLPSSVRILQIDTNDFIRPNSIPSTVKTLIFDDLDFIESSGNNGDGSIKKLDKITIKCGNQEFYTNIPNGIEYITHQQSNILYEFIPPPLSTNKFLLPNSIKSIKIHNEDKDIKNIEIHDIIQINSLPNSIESLSFNITENHKYLNINDAPSIFSNSLTDLELINTSLILGNNKSIKKGILPPQLKRLNLSGYYGAIEKGVLPSTLQSLILPCRYAKTIKECCLPKSLEYLSFTGPDCRIPIEPNHLVKSLFSKKNKTVLIQGSIPIGLKTLKLSEYQNYLDILVKGTLTEQHQSLTKLSINPTVIYKDSFTKHFTPYETQLKINHWNNNTKLIPSSLKNITSGTICDYGLEFELPITKIKIYSIFYPKSIPPSVTNIIYKVPILHTLKSFKPHSNDKNNENENNLKSLSLFTKVNTENDKLPESLETLYFYISTTIPSTPPNFFSNQLLNLKKLLLFGPFSIPTDIDLQKFPNIELLVLLGNFNFINDSLIKCTKLKKIIVSYISIDFLNDYSELQSIIQVENFNSIKQIKHLLL